MAGNSLKLAIILAAGLQIAAASDADSGKATRFWEALHRLEVSVIRDYRSRNTAPAALRRAEQIWTLQAQSTLAEDFRACPAAARTLSQMASSTHYDFRASRFPVDWHYLLPGYRQKRGRCLEALGFDEDRYPLPWWFGL